MCWKQSGDDTVHDGKVSRRDDGDIHDAIVPAPTNAHIITRSKQKELSIDTTHDIPHHHHIMSRMTMPLARTMMAMVTAVITVSRLRLLQNRVSVRIKFLGRHCDILRV